MKFTFFLKIKGPFTNIQNSKPGIQRFVAYGGSEVAEFFIVFPGVGGRLDAIWTFGFSGKAKRDGTFYFHFWK